MQNPSEDPQGRAVAAALTLPPESSRGVSAQLRVLRRAVLAGTLAPATVGLAAVLGGVAGWWVGVLAVVVALPVGVGSWRLIDRNFRSWRYAERADDLLVAHGVVFRQLVVVPYGRMQFVDVSAGPLERRFGIATVQLHTASAATDARIPGLPPGEAARLRDRLAELGEARSAGL
ncbi:MAG: PH domain-containing protein [Streptomycetales bacterium]